MINDQLSKTMMDLLNSSKRVAEEQAKYNEQINDIYYTYYEDDQDSYEVMVEQCEQEHELQLANLNSWEAELELEKNNIETRLNEINTYESTWTKLLQTNIKNNFTYGAVSQ